MDYLPLFHKLDGRPVLVIGGGDIALRKSVLLANPYFAPGRKFRRALAAAAERGVEVVLLSASARSGCRTRWRTRSTPSCLPPASKWWSITRRSCTPRWR